MNTKALKEWLSQPRTSLTAAVAQCVHGHVAGLNSRGIDFYGYALHTGERYDIHSLAAVYNSESDIKVPRGHEEYQNLRDSVDEWLHWDHDGFEPANRLLAAANQQFSRLHKKAEDDYQMDEFEISHSDALLEAVLQGLEAAKAEGAFSDESTYLAIWSNDSNKIIHKSIRRLNSAAKKPQEGGPCPKCGFSFGWNGATCSHCKYGIK